MISPFIDQAEATVLASYEQFQQDVPHGLKPGNPYEYREYPLMMYRASKMPNGQYACGMDFPFNFGFRDDKEYERAVEQALAFTKSCQREVKNEHERSTARSQGWRDSAPEALEYQESLRKLVGDEAAAANFRDKNMSEKALAEKAKLEAATFGHLAEIPEQPRAKRGRPKKAADQPAT